MTSESAALDADRLAAVSRALDLRLAHASYRQIGVQLGVSHETARTYVTEALASIVAEPAAELRSMMLASIDRLVMAHWPSAVGGDIQHTEMVRRLLRDKAILLGLDAPRKIDITNWIREMAEREGIDPGQAVLDAEAILKGATR